MNHRVFAPLKFNICESAFLRMRGESRGHYWREAKNEMTWEEWSGVVVSAVAILVGIIVAGKFLIEKSKRNHNRLLLEDYLEGEKEKGKDNGQRTMVHLTTKLSLSEDEVRHAVSTSSHIKARLTEDENGQSLRHLYEYVASK